MQWCGGVNYEGVLVFDESHKAKNLDMGVGDKRGTKSSKVCVSFGGRKKRSERKRTRLHAVCRHRMAA
jgi:hypothetical protein